MNSTYNIYDFTKNGSGIKTKYFAQNAYAQYLRWSSDKQILLVTAGAFSDSWENYGKPVGLCVENGYIINKVIQYNWDGMVLIYNTNQLLSDIVVVDIGVKNVIVNALDGSNQKYVYSLKSSAADRMNFLNWGEHANITLFQTQLLYSTDKYSNNNLNNPYYGDSRERRFLAVCTKNGITHDIIIDIPNEIKLNLATSYAKYVLEYAGYSVSYIMNLDTGDKNILYRYNGSYLQNMHPYKGNYPERATIENATNLLVFYKDI